MDGAQLVFVEKDLRCAPAVQQVFAEMPQVTIYHGDWHDVMPRSEPYDLLFMDATPHVCHAKEPL